MNIIKQASGNVVLTDATGNIEKVFINVNALEVKGTDEIIVKYGFNQWHSIFSSKIYNTQIEPALPVAFTGNVNDLVTLLSSSFFFELSGGGGDDLATVLIAGNSAGANDINLNGNDLLNVDTITSTGDLILNPVGSIDANGKTLNMTGGEIHNVPLIHSQNNTDLIVEGKGTGDLIFRTNLSDRLKITDTGNFIYVFYYTIELMSALTVDFYAPFDLQISAVINLVNSPTTTIQDDGIAYVLGATITAGSKITVTVNTAAVVNLKTIQV